MRSARIMAVGLWCAHILTGWAGEVVRPAPEDYLLTDVLEIEVAAGATIRLRDGRPRDTGPGNRLRDAASEKAFRRLAQRGAVWSRTHDAVPESFLDELRARAEAGKGDGRPAPDLHRYFRVRLPAGERAEDVAAELAALPDVVFVFRAPAPAPPPVMPNYSAPGYSATTWQRYLDAAPNGIDARYAHSNGWNGAGVRVCDIEYDYNGGHTDFPSITRLGAPRSTTYADHGTAVFGVLAGRDNTAGVRGITFGAPMYIASPYASGIYNIAASITIVLSTLQTGDVILIEQQMYGPSSSAYVPVEWYKPTYDAIRAAVLANVSVVEAGGNGSQNLDAAIYSTGNGGHYPFLTTNDSGAIIVGAGAAPQSATPRSKLSFSNYGVTVDLQGYGEQVVTTGYGGLYSAEGTNANLTSTFNGTSSASPVVAGAVAVLQQVWRLLHGVSATPAQVKEVLRATGTPQQGTGNIGPLPDLRAAIEGAARIDEDSDGLPDVWERAHYGGIGQGANSDTDGDGFTLIEEYVAGTQPTNSQSRFAAVAVSNDAGRAVAFASVTGRAYRLSYADTPATAWQPVAGQTNVSGTGSTQSLVDTNPAPARVYRLDVRMR